MAPGSPVVCLNCAKQPTTWGTVVTATAQSAEIKYGEGAPIWDSKTWAVAYLRQCESIEEARKLVEDFDDRK